MTVEISQDVEKCASRSADAPDVEDNEISSNLKSKSKTWITSHEPRMFDRDVEEEGCKKIVECLTEDELRAMPDENMPLRHFRADKGNVKKAIKRIKYALKWRQEFGVEKILRAATDPKTAEEKEIHSVLVHECSPGKMYIRNHDNDKRAIMYMYPIRENSNHPKNNIIHLVYQIERAIACTEKNGLEKIVIIMDFENWKMKHSAPMEVTKQTIHILQECYVERMAKAYITNAPLVFRTFWNIVRPFLDPVTKEKVIFCSSKKGIQELKIKFDEKKVEKCALGSDNLRKFDVDEYFATPLHSTFDELD